LGDGVIGLLMVALLRREGVRSVNIVGGRPRRLDMGGRLGANATLNYHTAADLQEEIRKQLGEDYPLVVEASGSAQALEAGLSVLAKEGAVLLMGDYGKATAAFPWVSIIHREWSFIGTNASAGAWAEAVQLATSREIQLADFVSHRLPAENFEDAIRLARSARDVIKVVMEWNHPTP
jgi:L-iditol 2-dehydrogenase